MTNEPLTKDKITIEEALKIVRELVENHPERIEAHGLGAIQRLIKHGVEAERKKWLSAVRLLREKGYCKNCYTSLSKKGFKCKATESGFHDFIIPLEDFDEVFGGVEK